MTGTLVKRKTIHKKTTRGAPVRVSIDRHVAAWAEKLAGPDPTSEASTARLAILGRRSPRDSAPWWRPAQLAGEIR
jgi:hypothetical protein